MDETKYSGSVKAQHIKQVVKIVESFKSLLIKWSFYVSSVVHIECMIDSITSQIDTFMHGLKSTYQPLMCAWV